MKLLSYVAICALSLLSISSCQKSDSQKTIDQKPPADTLLTHLNVVLRNALGSREYHYDLSYDNSSRLSRFAMSWGDTIANFTYDERGYLMGFVDSTTTDPAGHYVGQLDTYTIQYGSNKIMVTDNWHTATQKGVKTRELTLMDSLIVGVVTSRENYTDTTKYTFDGAGNVVGSQSSASGFVGTLAYDKNYRNPFFIKSNPIFTLIFLGDLSRNALSAASSTKMDEMGNVITTSVKADVLEHLGSYPTKMQMNSAGSPSDYTFTYSVRNN